MTALLEQLQLLFGGLGSSFILGILWGLVYCGCAIAYGIYKIKTTRKHFIYPTVSGLILACPLILSTSVYLFTTTHVTNRFFIHFLSECPCQYSLLSRLSAALLCVLITKLSLLDYTRTR